MNVTQRLSRYFFNYQGLTAAAVLALACVTSLLAPTAAQAQTNVALVDIGKIFKSHPVFGQQLEGLRQEAEQFKAQTQQMQQALQQEAQGLREYEPTSPEFKAEETRLAQKSAAKEVEQRNKMRDLMKKEAQLHFDTYNEIKAMIAEYAQKQGVRMVMRYNSQEIDPSVPASIMQKVNGSIVFHTNQKDITEEVVGQIARTYAASNGGGSDTNRR